MWMLEERETTGRGTVSLVSWCRFPKGMAPRFVKSLLTKYNLGTYLGMYTPQEK